MKNMRIKGVFFAVVLFIAIASSTNAQNTKKPKPLATPPVITGAEIISQAGDYAEPSPSPADKTPTKPGTTNAAKINDLNERIKKLEAGQKDDYDQRQKRLLMNLDILTRAEQRTESLRKQVFEMIDKENALRSRLEQIDYDIRPEVIERTNQITGSLRPEEIRENRRKGLAAEKANLESLLTQVQTTRATIEANLLRADQMVEKLRAKAEKEIDDALSKDDEETKPEQQPDK